MEKIETAQKTIRIRARVAKVENQRAFIQAENGCGRCHEKGGCGGAKLTQIFCAKPKIFPVENSADARAGDAVEVEIPQKTLNLSATLGYGLPLIAFILGAVLGDYFWGEAGAIAISFALLAIVFCTLKISARNLKNPARIVRRL